MTNKNLSSTWNSRFLSSKTLTYLKLHKQNKSNIRSVYRQPTQSDKFHLNKSLQRTNMLWYRSFEQLNSFYKKTQFLLQRKSKIKVRIRKKKDQFKQTQYQHQKHHTVFNNRYICQQFKTFNLCGYQQGARFINCSGRLLLFQGFKNNARDKLRIYQYFQKNKLWKQVYTKGQGPITWRLGYGLVYYPIKNCVFLIGGMNFTQDARSRKIFGDCYIFSAKQNCWSKMKLDTEDIPLERRNHATCLFRSFVFIYGGIIQKQEYTNSVFLLSRQKCQQIFIKDNVKQIAYHTIYSHLQAPIPFILSFGGRNKQGHCYGNMRILKMHSVQTDLFQDWQNIECQGIGPKPRCMHVMQPLLKYNQLLISGGINVQTNQIFQDAYIFDILKNTWTELQLIGPSKLLKLYGQTCVASDQNIIFFGGFNIQRKMNNNLFYLLPQTN